jgi:hypothetical protein
MGREGGGSLILTPLALFGQLAPWPSLMETCKHRHGCDGKKHCSFPAKAGQKIYHGGNGFHQSAG